MEPVSPVTRTKEEAKTSYNKMSRWYDLLAGVSEKSTKMQGWKGWLSAMGNVFLKSVLARGNA